MRLTGRRVLFAVAAGPQMGFGHLARSRALARTLGVSHVVMLRGSAATRRAARAMGATLCRRASSTIATVAPDLVIVDDPSAAAARVAVRWARQSFIPVASLHDVGRAHVASDLVIDATQPATVQGAPAQLAGPAFTVVDPAFRDLRREAAKRTPHRILIALGGGHHVRQHGVALAAGLCGALPAAHVIVAPGFGRGSRPRLPRGARWLASPDQLGRELARCAVAIIGGGITLAEACVLGTPTVALAVTRAQRPTVAAYAASGAVIDAGLVGRPEAVTAATLAVGSLLYGPKARQLARRASHFIDGDGALRVASALSWLVAHAEGRLHVA